MGGYSGQQGIWGGVEGFAGRGHIQAEVAWGSGLAVPWLLSEGRGTVMLRRRPVRDRREGEDKYGTKGKKR